MRMIFKILFGSLLILGFSQCGSCKDSSYILQSNTPFTIEEAIYVDWIAGVKGGGSGTNIFISIKDLDSDNVEIDSMYFRNQKVKIELKESNYIGRFKSKKNQREDKFLHSNSKKEYGNQPPKREYEFPFEIENDEAVISYTEKGKLNFFKIKLEKGESRLYH